MPRARATKRADKADRIDNIVVKICGIEAQYARSSCRSRRISPPRSIIALCDCWRAPSKVVAQAKTAWQSRTASCYTTASPAAALGHLGAVHKRGLGAKTARSREGGGWQHNQRIPGESCSKSRDLIKTPAAGADQNESVWTKANEKGDGQQ